MENSLVEDYRAGYPRYSALLAAHDSFSICRRFSNLRTRLLLLKQDKLSLLEKELEKVDAEEATVLSLGSSRCDTNPERCSILSAIDSALADYDQFVERNHRMLELSPANPRDILSLQNWVNGVACLARDETAYLTQRNDLLCVASTDDNCIKATEAWLEDSLIRFCKGFRKLPCHNISRDPDTYINSGSALIWTARMLIVSLVLILLLVPVLICHILSSMTARLVIILLSSACSLTILSIITKARATELFVGGATYCTVLTAFVVSTGSVTK